MKNIYVGNLSFQTTEEELRNFLGRYGKVDRVSIPPDTATGRPRGFAFVEMRDDSAAERAIRELNGSSLGNRRLTVSEARPKPERVRTSPGNSERSFGRG